MSKQLTLTNAAMDLPALTVTAIGLTAVRIDATDGLGGAIQLTLPRAQAAKIANALNGTVNAQVFEELENAERAGTITDAQARSLAKKREARARTEQMNAERKAAAEARRAAEGKSAPKGKLKAVG